MKINRTQIRTLITNALQDDVLLSWRDMIRLSIIPADFPQPQTSSVAVCKLSGDEEMKIKQLQEDLIKEFPDVFQDVLPDDPMQGPPMTIELQEDPNMRPRCATTCKPIPLHMEEAAEKCLQGPINDGVVYL